MYYSVHEGMQNTWSDRFGSVTQHVTARNWLPVGAIGLVVLWIGLIFAAMQQTGSGGPGAPSDLTATRNNPPMSVTSAATAGSGNLAVGSTPDTHSSAQSTAITAPATRMDGTSVPEPASPIASLTEPIIGGRGGAEETPALPATPEPSVGLEVNTPITPEPIGVDVGTDDGLQAGVNLGGLLDVDLDLGLGL